MLEGATIADSIAPRPTAETVLLRFIFAFLIELGLAVKMRPAIAKKATCPEGLGLGSQLESIIDASSGSIEMIGADAASDGVDVEIFELCGPILCKAPFDTKAGCDSWPPF